MIKSLHDAPDISTAAGLPRSRSLPARLRPGADGGDVAGDDHGGADEDTGHVAPGNGLPGTALLKLWPLLPALRMVVEFGGVRAAAGALGVQAPAVSKAIRQIEVALGEPLFHRVGRALVPTTRARALHREVRAAMRVVDTVLHEERPLRLMVHPVVTRRLLLAARGLPVARVAPIRHVADAMGALRSGVIDAVVGLGGLDARQRGIGGDGDIDGGSDGDGDIDIDITVVGAIAEVEVGGDGGLYDGDDTAGALVATGLGYRAWIAADDAPPGLAVRARRHRDIWIAHRVRPTAQGVAMLSAALQRVPASDTEGP